MKRRDRKPRKNTRNAPGLLFAQAPPSKRTGQPPFVRAAMESAMRQHIHVAVAQVRMEIEDEERLLRDADELHRRQKEPCDVTSRREAVEIMNTFWREML